MSENEKKVKEAIHEAEEREGVANIVDICEFDVEKAEELDRRIEMAFDGEEQFTEVFKKLKQDFDFDENFFVGYIMGRRVEENHAMAFLAEKLGRAV